MSVAKRRAEAAPIETARTSIDWVRLLSLLLKCLALIAMMRGLAKWAVIFGVVEMEGQDFELLPPALQGEIIFFAVFELVAAVGLWLGAVWGGVLWVMTVVVALTVDAAVAGFGYEPLLASERHLALSALDVALLCFYLVVSRLAARQIDQGPG